MDMIIDMDMFLQQYGPLLSSPLPHTTSPQIIDYFSFGKDKDGVGPIDYLKSSTAREEQAQFQAQAEAQGRGQGLEGVSDIVAGSLSESKRMLAPRASAVATATVSATSAYIASGSFPLSPNDDLMPLPPLSSPGDQVNNHSGTGPKEGSSKSSATSTVTPSSPNNSHDCPDDTYHQGQVQPKNEVGPKPKLNHNDDCHYNQTLNPGPLATSTAFDSLQDFPFPYQPTPLEPEIERFLNSYFPKETFSNGFGLSSSHSNGVNDGNGKGAGPSFNSSLDSNSASNPTPGFEDYLDIPDDTPGMTAAYGMGTGGLEKRGMAQEWAHVNGNGSEQSQGDEFEKVSLLNAGSGSGATARPSIPTDFLSRVLWFSWDDLGHFRNELENR
jgi:hypothetical protein